MANKNRRMTVRIGSDEDEIVRSVSSSLGVSESEAVRLSIRSLGSRVSSTVDERLSSRPVAPEVTELHEVTDLFVSEVRRVGANLNQAVRAGHINGWTADDLDPIRKAIMHLDVVMDQVRSAVDDVSQ
ncbi:hypothetical protein [Brevibacterium aurantiacum]|uniref:hypothetical protein n=1 Tax=Brevibacterium aurantiacum TaxID=273384 RepID=UPI003F9B6E63